MSKMTCIEKLFNNRFRVKFKLAFLQSNSREVHRYTQCNHNDSMSFNVLHSGVSECPLCFSYVNQAVLQKKSTVVKNIQQT